MGVGFEPTVGVNPQSLSRRSRYGRFGTPPSTEAGPTGPATMACILRPEVTLGMTKDRKEQVYEGAWPLRSRKNLLSSSEHSSSRTPVVISTRWLSLGS